MLSSVIASVLSGEEGAGAFAEGPILGSNKRNARTNAFTTTRPMMIYFTRGLPFKSD
jgi:hypothetical protein